MNNPTATEERQLMDSLPGRTITAITTESHFQSQHEEPFAYLLTLDDGRTIRFAGWGTDEWAGECSLDLT